MESDEPKPEAADDAALTPTEQNRLMLRELAEIGLRMCDILRKQVEAGKKDAAVAARDCDKIARSVRRTLALEQQIAQDAARSGAAEPSSADRDAAAPTSRAKPAPKPSAVRARLEREFFMDAMVPSAQRRGLLH